MYIIVSSIIPNIHTHKYIHTYIRTQDRAYISDSSIITSIYTYIKNTNQHIYEHTASLCQVFIHTYAHMFICSQVRSYVRESPLFLVSVNTHVHAKYFTQEHPPLIIPHRQTDIHTFADTYKQKSVHTKHPHQSCAVYTHIYTNQTHMKVTSLSSTSVMNEYIRIHIHNMPPYYIQYTYSVNVLTHTR